MKKDILLISSNFENIPELGGKKQCEDETVIIEDSHYPLGISYIHSFLESKSFSVRTFSFNGSSEKACFKKVIEKIEENTPKIIGFQMLTANRFSTFNLLNYINKKYPKIKLVVGGIHATIFSSQLAKKFPFAIFIRGEGELTFEELSQKIINKKKISLKKIKGLTFYEKGEIYSTPNRELIPNLDILPFPKHEEFFRGKRKVLSILTSRGCPFACSFCCLQSISQRKTRFRSVKNVVDEIEYFLKKYPQIKEVMIQDDTFFLNNKRAIEICEEIIKRELNSNFVCSGRMKPISKEMVIALEKAGFTKVLLGLESGDKDVLEKTHKGIVLSDAINAFKLFKNSKIELHTFLIVGLPGETEKSIDNTIKFVKKLQRIKYFHFGEPPLLAIYPGTEIYEISKQKGLLNDNYWFEKKGIPIFVVENSLKKLFMLRKKLSRNLVFTYALTPKGFISQFFMLPYLIKYTLKYKRKGFLNRIKLFLKEKSFRPNS